MRASQQPTPVVKDLVFLGGGHSHVIVLKSFGMKPMPGVRLTLVSRDVHTPYSGMLPGYVAGHYAYEDCHIDLRRLARFAGARLIHCSASGIDMQLKQVLLDGRPPMKFDVLSLDIGVTSLQQVSGAAKYTTPVKPINLFHERWQKTLDRITSCPSEEERIAIVGGGAGGVELCLAIQHRLLEELKIRGKSTGGLSFQLYTRSRLLPMHAPAAGKMFERILRDRGVQIVQSNEIAEVQENVLLSTSGQKFAFSECFWCTEGGAPAWLNGTELALDRNGFVSIEETLQSISHTGIFAAGDIHASDVHPRPKAGVFAVRQGPPLADNLRRHLLGKSLKPFRPQLKYLSLISTGNKYAIATRGDLAFEGSLLWLLKDWIDRGFMRKFSELPDMEAKPSLNLPVARAAGEGVMAALAALPMRCGGCGAKVGATVLSRALARLKVISRPEVVIGLESPDDASVVRLPPGKVIVHTVDFFRSFVEDPYLFGKIAATHALGDCYAMGAEPLTALAIATVPYNTEDKARTLVKGTKLEQATIVVIVVVVAEVPRNLVEEELYQAMAGATDVLNAARCQLVGGHTSEGVELSLGFAINGMIEESSLLRKGGMMVGDVLILTKAIGTGTLFAADMRAKAKGFWIEVALRSMLLPNKVAAEILGTSSATACTDVTGFGLLGHLVEMVKASGIHVYLDLAAIPILVNSPNDIYSLFTMFVNKDPQEGAEECVGAGLLSSLQPSNLQLRRSIQNLDEANKDPRFPLLFDPQTAGGLLASVPAGRAQDCIHQLRHAGYPSASIIGQVVSAGASDAPIFVQYLRQPQGAIVGNYSKSD
eukprot:SM000003S11056  [mRNA]  locus=s3:656468:663565:+ [translate_table: standard]